MSPRGTYRHAEHLGGLLDAQLLVEHQVQDLPLSLRQLVEGALEARRGFAGHYTAGVGPLVTVPAAPFEPLLQPNQPEPALPAFFQCGPAYYSKEPGSEAGAPIEAGFPVDDTEVRGVQRVLGRLAASGRTAERPGKGVGVHPCKLGFEFVAIHQHPGYLISVPGPAGIGQPPKTTIYYASMDLRRATLADLPRLVPLFDAYRQFYGQPFDPGRAERFLRERLAGNESVIYLAEENGSALGFVQLYPSFWSVAACRSWILNDLFVSPEHRRTGTGKALMGRALAHAKETGAGGLSLATHCTNLTAQRLYESLGWQRDEEFFHYEMEL